MSQQNSISIVESIKSVGRFISITAFIFLPGPIAIVLLADSEIGGLTHCIPLAKGQVLICLEKIHLKHGSQTLPKSEPSQKSAESPPPDTLRNTSPNLPPPPVVLPVPSLPPVGGGHPAR